MKIREKRMTIYFIIACLLTESFVVDGGKRYFNITCSCMYMYQTTNFTYDIDHDDDRDYSGVAYICALTVNIISCKTFVRLT